MSKYFCALEKGLSCEADVNGYCTKWGHCDNKRSRPTERPDNFDNLLSKIKDGSICNKKDASFNKVSTSLPVVEEYSNQNSYTVSEFNKVSTSLPVVEEYSNQNSYTVSEFNKVFSPISNKARSFVWNLNHAIDKSGDEAKYQTEVIGWDEETKGFILKAIECYEQSVRNCIKRER